MRKLAQMVFEKPQLSQRYKKTDTGNDGRDTINNTEEAASMNN